MHSNTEVELPDQEWPSMFPTPDFSAHLSVVTCSLNLIWLNLSSVAMGNTRKILVNWRSCDYCLYYALGRMQARLSSVCYFACFN